jgi:hypothetical protein
MEFCSVPNRILKVVSGGDHIRTKKKRINNAPSLCCHSRTRNVGSHPACQIPALKVSAALIWRTNQETLASRLIIRIATNCGAQRRASEPAPHLLAINFVVLRTGLENVSIVGTVVGHHHGLLIRGDYGLSGYSMPR